jgi:hypothetical protein
MIIQGVSFKSERRSCHIVSRRISDLTIDKNKGLVLLNSHYVHLIIIYFLVFSQQQYSRALLDTKIYSGIFVPIYDIFVNFNWVDIRWQ